MVFVNEIGKRNLDNLKAVNRDSETLHDMDCSLDSESIDRRSLPHVSILFGLANYTLNRTAS